MRRFATTAAFASLALLSAIPAHAQLNGAHLLGDFGINSGTQPPQGFYAAGVYYRYSTETIKDRDGNKRSLFPGDPSSLAINAYAAILWYVSKAKIFGANYGAFVVPAWVDGSIEAPALSLGRSSATKFTDLTVRPIDLGWHLSQADVSAGFQFYAPTGTYEAGGDGNTGKGMWSYEPFVGTTVYFDQKKTLSVATTAFLEFHGKKKDTDVKVGEILSLEGGLGKSFLGGGVIVGGAYYAQWKIGADELGTFTLPGGGTVDPTLSENKHKVFGFGPDLTLPIATKKKLFALVNFRYLWETGARTKTEGNTLLVTATLPIPSVNLQ